MSPETVAIGQPGPVAEALNPALRQVEQAQIDQSPESFHPAAAPEGQPAPQQPFRQQIINGPYGQTYEYPTDGGNAKLTGISGPGSPGQVAPDDPWVKKQVQDTERAADQLRINQQFSPEQRQHGLTQLQNKMDLLDPEQRYRKNSLGSQQTAAEKWMAENVMQDPRTGLIFFNDGHKWTAHELRNQEDKSHEIAQKQQERADKMAEQLREHALTHQREEAKRYDTDFHHFHTSLIRDKLDAEGKKTGEKILPDVEEVHKLVRQKRAAEKAVFAGDSDPDHQAIYRAKASAIRAGDTGAQKAADTLAEIMAIPTDERTDEDRRQFAAARVALSRHLPKPTVAEPLAPKPVPYTGAGQEEPPAPAPKPVYRERQPGEYMGRGAMPVPKPADPEELAKEARRLEEWRKLHRYRARGTMAPTAGMPSTDPRQPVMPAPYRARGALPTGGE